MQAVLAVAPYEQFVRERAHLFVLIVCVLLALLVARTITRIITRRALFTLIALIAVFTISQRSELTECAETCECAPAGAEVRLPYCERGPG